MSSSSSDSDSDDLEPIRKIKINIRPKNELVQRGAADINEIKASVESWRPLGPPPHSSLSRRQSSLSSMSSASFASGFTLVGSSGNGAPGTSTNAASSQTGAPWSSTLRSSPSCSSLVNEFSNRSSFSNFMSSTPHATLSRTSSPLTVVNHGDTVPIAIAIQESIELISKGYPNDDSNTPEFSTRSIGNLKVAFPNAFAKGVYGKPNTALKLRMHNVGNVVRFFSSSLIGGVDSEANLSKGGQQTYPSTALGDKADGPSLIGEHQQSAKPTNGNSKPPADLFSDSFDTNESPGTQLDDSKVIEFDSESLMKHLAKMFEQSPTSRYYNIDVLRYQIAPIKTMRECPLQVCAYWKIESDVIKLRIDFKHPTGCGINLERLRDVSFSASFAEFIPPGANVIALTPEEVMKLRLNNNNNFGTQNLNQNSPVLIQSARSVIQRPTGMLTTESPLLRGAIAPPPPPPPPSAPTTPAPIDMKTRLLPPPPSAYSSRGLGGSNRRDIPRDPFGAPTRASQRLSDQSSPGEADTKPQEGISRTGSPSSKDTQNEQPYITYKPPAQWDNSIKQITWKFDTLLAFHKTDGMGSLLAKLDFRNNSRAQPTNPAGWPAGSQAKPVDVKFQIVDSTLSKLGVSVESAGYKLSMLKREIRSGRYRSEPQIL